MMQWYTAFEPGTGRILAAFTADDEAMVQANTPAGAQVIEGYFGVREGYIADGEFVKFPARPSPNHKFDYAIKTWVDPRSLEQFKAGHWEAIKAERSQREYAGFTWEGSGFDADPLSQSRIQGAVQLASLDPATFSIDWTLADNTVRTLSGADMVAVGLALAQHVNALHVIARGLRNQIEAATTREEVEAVTWPAA